MLTNAQFRLPDTPPLTGNPGEQIATLSKHIGDIKRSLSQWFVTLNAPGGISPSECYNYQASGNVLFPSYAFSGDVDTGFYLAADGTVGLATGGVGSFLFTVDGIGFGLTPSYPFHAKHDANTVVYSFVGASYESTTYKNSFGIGWDAAGDFSHIGNYDNFPIRFRTNDVDRMMLDTSGNMVIPKTSGVGIKVEIASPTFPWHDMLGPISIRGIGATDPSYNVYQGSLRGYQFDPGEEVFVEFHIPHDYVPGSDLYIHAHWSVKNTTTSGAAAGAVTGGSVTWGFEVTYAKGHNQGAFIAPITTTIAQNASTTEYQHMLAEVQLSAASPSAAQLDSDNIEIDGLILVRCYLSANDMTVAAGSVPDPFLHMVDIHYQSTNIGTKQKAPNFYT